MPDIKKYSLVNPSDEYLSFSIKRMEDIFDLHHGKPDEPHRHEYYTVVLVKNASGRHMIDFREFDLSDRQVYFISPGQVHQIIEDEKSFGWALTFSRQFLIENHIETSFLEDLHLFRDFGDTPPLLLTDEELGVLNAYAEEMDDFVKSDKKFRYQAVGALLKLFLIQCNHSCDLGKVENTQVAQASVTLLRSFKQLLNQHFERWHKVSEYAEAMFITPDHLNNAVKSMTGKTAKEHIQARITLAARRYLLFSDFTLKEIAYQLGFSEPANFSQFFKKCTGESPSVWRERH